MYAWIIVAALAVFHIIISFAFQFNHPLLSRPYDFAVLQVLRAWGVSDIGFYLLALAVTLKGFRRAQRWAWYVLWYLPVAEVANFFFGGGFSPPPENMTVHHLVLTAAFLLALLLPYRKLFPKKQPV